MKIVINKCYGGFGLSPEALQRLYDMGMTEIATPTDEYYPLNEREENAKKYPFISYDTRISKWREYTGSAHEGHSLFLTVFTPDEKYVLNGGRKLTRHDPRLVQVVEEMGHAADGACAELAVVEIPDGVEYEVEEYDGLEHIAETHRTWS